MHDLTNSLKNKQIKV